MRDLKDMVKMYPEDGTRANIYAITLPDGGLVLIDPSALPPALGADALNRLAMLVATHGHFDHTAAAAAILKQRPDLPYLMHKDDFEMSEDPYKNVSALFGTPVATGLPNREIREDEPISLSENLRLMPLHTPGHTPGSVCLLLEQLGEDGAAEPVALFTGDTIIGMSVGRHDLPGGSQRDLSDSLKRIVARAKAYPFPDDLPLYFGHGPSMTWKETLNNNFWLSFLK